MQANNCRDDDTEGAEELHEVVDLVLELDDELNRLDENGFDFSLTESVQNSVDI